MRSRGRLGPATIFGTCFRPIVAVNQTQKRERLPSAALLERCRDRIAEWWAQGYLTKDVALQAQFHTEAAATLPALGARAADLDEVFGGLQFRRGMIRADHQVAEWDGPG